MSELVSELCLAFDALLSRSARLSRPNVVPAPCRPTRTQAHRLGRPQRKRHAAPEPEVQQLATRMDEGWH
jgi:hypothetical protein